MHISELAQHHVENPREVVEPGRRGRVKILEIDSERRRLSLSVKRVEGQIAAISGTAVERRAPSAATTRRGARPRPVRGRLRRPQAERGAADLRAAAARQQAAEADAGGRRRGRRGRRAEAPRGRGRGAERGRRRARGSAAAAGGRAGRGRGSAEPSCRRRDARRDRRDRAQPRCAGPVRRPDRRHRRRQVRGAGRLERLGAATLSTDAVVHELLATDEVRDVVVERWGADVAPGRRGRPRRGRRARVRRRRGREPGSRAPVAAGRASGSPSGASELAPRAGAAGGGRRGAAAVRVRDGGAPSTRRSRWSPTRTCARARRRRGHAASAERDGAPAARRTRRRSERTTRSATTARSTSWSRRCRRYLRRLEPTDELARSTLAQSPAAARAGARARRAPPLVAAALACCAAASPLRARWAARATRSGRSRCRCATRTSSASRPRQEPRPGADRRRDLRGVEVPRPDLARRRARADADHARHGRLHRPPARAAPRSSRATWPPRRSTSPTAPGTCATCSTATTATRRWRSPPTTRARRNVDSWVRRGRRPGRLRRADDIPFPETRAYVENVSERRGQYREHYAASWAVGASIRSAGCAAMPGRRLPGGVGLLDGPLRPRVALGRLAA